MTNIGAINITLVYDNICYATAADDTNNKHHRYVLTVAFIQGETSNALHHYPDSCIEFGQEGGMQ